MGFHYERCALSGLTITEDDHVYAFQLIDCNHIENHFYFLENEIVPSHLYVTGKYDDYGFIKGDYPDEFKNNNQFAFILSDILSKLIVTHDMISPVRPYRALSFESANHLGTEYLNWMEAMLNNYHLDNSDIYEVDEKICENNSLLKPFSKLFIAPNKMISGFTALPHIRDFVASGNMEKATNFMKRHIILTFTKDIMREHNREWKASNSFTQEFDARKALDLNELANSFLKSKIQR